MENRDEQRANEDLEDLEDKGKTTGDEARPLKDGKPSTANDKSRPVEDEEQDQFLMSGIQSSVADTSGFPGPNERPATETPRSEVICDASKESRENAIA